VLSDAIYLVAETRLGVGRTITGEVTAQQQGHCIMVSPRTFVLLAPYYQITAVNHGTTQRIEFPAGQVRQLLLKAAFHTEQQEVLMRV